MPEVPATLPPSNDSGGESKSVSLSLEDFHQASVELVNHGLMNYDSITVIPGEPPVNVKG